MMGREAEMKRLELKSSSLWPFATMTTGSQSPAKCLASMYCFKFMNFITSAFGVGLPMSS